MDKTEIQYLLKKNMHKLESMFGVTNIGLFGSYARDENNEQSDIDIVVEVMGADLFLMASLKNYLENIFQKKVDIVRLRKNMNNLLKKRIEQNALYVR
ncbi:MAG: nucleotidyltransferase family protein [Ignavibacteriaceae bacterium]|nr:nucleotidyltransferase family protein [Ignavibacteriaceae bacterium]